MKKEQITELENRAWFAERWAKEHDLTEEDLVMSTLIRKMPVEIVKFKIPKT